MVYWPRFGTVKQRARAPPRPLDPSDPESPEVERFFLLDRPRIEARSGLKPEDIPLVLGEVLFSNDTVILETYDDGRLDRLVDRFTAMAGSNIPPAHPRTKIIGKEQRHLLALSWRGNSPRGLTTKTPSGSTTSKSLTLSATSGPRHPIRLCGGGVRHGPRGRVIR